MTADLYTLLRAAEILAREAQDIRECHSRQGQWVLREPSDFAARADHDEMVAIAAELRRSAG